MNNSEKNGIWHNLKNISPFIYALGFITFFMQVGATIVHGSSNTVISGRLITAFQLILLRNVNDSLGNFFKIIVGYISDRIENRMIFLVIGYGLGIFLKFFFLFSTFDINIEFLTILYILTHFFDRLGNAIRDPIKEAFIADNTTESTRLMGFFVRKGIGSLGTPVGGIIAYILLSRNIVSHTTLFGFAIIPVSISCLLLFLMIKSQSKIKNNYGQLFIKLTIFISNISTSFHYKGNLLVSLGTLFLGVTTFMKFNLRSLLLAIIVFINFIVFIEIPLLNSFYWINIFRFTNWVMNLCFVFYWFLYTKCDSISSIFRTFFEFIFLTLLCLSSNNNLLNCNVCNLFNFGSFLKILSLNDNFIFSSQLLTLILFYIMRNNNFITKFVYIVFFKLIKDVLFFYFMTNGNPELYNIVFESVAFFSCLILYFLHQIIIKYSNLRGYLVFVTIFFLKGSFFLHFYTYNNIDVAQILIMNIFFKLFMRFFVTYGVFSALNKQDFFEFMLKMLPIELFIFSCGYLLEQITPGFYLLINLCIEIIYHYNLQKVSGANSAQHIYHVYKNIILLPTVLILNEKYMLIYKHLMFYKIKINTIIAFIISLISLLILYKAQIDYKKFTLNFCLFFGLFVNIPVSVSISFLILNTPFNEFIQNIINFSITKFSFFLIVYLSILTNPSQYIDFLSLLVLTLAFYKDKPLLIMNICLSCILTVCPISLAIKFILFILINYFCFKKDDIQQYIGDSHIVMLYKNNRIDFKNFFYIMVPTILVSSGKLTESIFFQRAIEIGFSGAFINIVISIIFFFVTLSSILITLIKNFIPPNKLYLLVIFTLIISNVLMSGYVINSYPQIMFCVSLFFYGIFTGAFETLILSHISNKTQNKKIIGTLYGIFFFFSGWLSLISSYISYIISKYLSCGICGIIAIIPCVIGLILCFRNPKYQIEKI